MTSLSKEFQNTSPEALAEGRLAIDTKQLFGRANEVLLVHDDVVYRLRNTKAGKLILTK